MILFKVMLCACHQVNPNDVPLESTFFTQRRSYISLVITMQRKIRHEKGGKKPKKKAKKQVQAPSENNNDDTNDDDDAALIPPEGQDAKKDKKPPKVAKKDRMPPEQAKLIKKATVSLELFEKIEREWHVVGSKLPKECSFLVAQQSQPGLGRIPIIPEICFRLWGPNGRCCQEAHCRGGKFKWICCM